MSEFNTSGGLTRILRAFGYSLQGLRAAFRHEAAFRQELVLAVLLLPLGLWLGEGGVERALLAGSWVLVLIVELLNSAIEATVDRFGPEHHELVRAGEGYRLGSGDAVDRSGDTGLGADPAAACCVTLRTDTKNPARERGFLDAAGLSCTGSRGCRRLSG